MPVLRGWGAGLTVVCNLGGPWTPDTEPPADRQVVPLTAPASELADVDSALELVDSLSLGSDGWTFASDEARCASWIELENALEQTGHVIQSRYIVENTGEQDVWQVRMSVVSPEGELALVSTTGALSIDPSPLPQLSEAQGLPRTSGLGACWLDSPVPTS